MPVITAKTMVRSGGQMPRSEKRVPIRLGRAIGGGGSPRPPPFAALQQIRRDQRPRRFGGAVAGALQHLAAPADVDSLEQAALEHHARDVVCAAADTGDATSVESCRRDGEPRGLQADWTLHVFPPKPF